MMDLDELQSVRDRERQTDKLQQLRESFYADAGEFIQQLRAQRDRAAERADDPFDAPEVNRLTDEIDTAETTVEAIYEKRVGKIVKAASFAAADLPAESDGMTAEESDLFDRLVADIKENREHVLDVLAGETDEPETAGRTEDASGQTPSEATGTPVPPNPAETDLSPPVPDGRTGDDSGSADGMGVADAMGGSEASDEIPDTAGDRSEASDGRGSTTGDDTPKRRESGPAIREDGGTATGGSGVDRETVRITAEVGGILGVDEREYDLAENDVVTLPSANAEPLLERDAAERLD